MDTETIANRLQEFHQKSEASVSDRQRVLEFLRRELRLTKPDFNRMSIQEAVEVLTMILELPEVSALSRADEKLSIGELTYKKRGPRSKKDVVDDGGETA